MKVIIGLLQIIGSLGLFLFGIKLLSEGLQKSAGNKMKSILRLMTKNRTISIVTGIIITTIMMRKNTIARTSMARKDTIIITMMKNITARISMAKRAIIMIMTTFMAITTITNTAIWRMSWRSLTALP